MNQRPITTEPERLPGPTPRRASLLWVAAAILLVYSGVIAATGGIDITLGGLRLRSRTWQRPALVGLVCLAGVAIADRRRARVAVRNASRAIARAPDAAWLLMSPHRVASAATLWTLVGGVMFSTFVAGGADSSGYLNQARLFAAGHVLDVRRVPELPPWPQPLFKLAPLGFRPTADHQRLAPTYPPGYPLLMAPVFLVDERAAHLVVPLCGALVVWLTFALGRRLREPGAGAAAALLVSVSPTFLYQLMQPMSDVPAAAAWVLALCLATSPARSSAMFSGLASGMAILIRPNLMPLAVLVWAACAVSGRSPGRWRRASAAALATAPAVVALGLIQSIRYGTAFGSGYGSMRDLFAWSNIGPNLERYPRWMFETHTPLVALFVLAPLWIVQRRDECRWLFLILWLFVGAVVLAYLPYVYFKDFEWTYTRFLLPALPLMWLLTLTPAARLLRRGRRAAAWLLAVPAVACLVIFSLSVAKQRYVFGLRDGERKYDRAGDYVRRVLPVNAILISMQHSGSLWFYTRRPILRWDQIDPRRLDEAIAWSFAQGDAPFIVADGEEMERMTERFGRQTLSRARSVANFGDVTVYQIN